MCAGKTCFTFFLVEIVLLGWWASGLADAKDAPLPIPNRAARVKSLRVIRELYKAEFEQAVTRPQRLNLARKFIDLALATREDPAGRYVLFNEAVRLAVEARDVTASFRAIDEMARYYRVDARSMKSVALRRMAESAKKPIEKRNLAASALSAIDGVIESDEYGIAEQLAKVARDSARKARDGDLVRQVKARTDELADAKRAYGALEGALAILRNRPDDPKANLVAGSYYCFHKRDWDRGIPLLTRGSDPVLRALAQRELQGTTHPSGMVEVADKWLGLAERETGGRKTAMLSRASHWYNKALPELSGLTKQTVERQLERINRSLGPTGEIPAGQPVFTSPRRVIATDNHEGESGRFSAKNVYVLASQRPVLLNQTAVFYQAQGAAGEDTSGTVSFSLDQKTWIAIGEWTPASMKAAATRGNWHRVDFSAFEKEIRANRIFVRFQYTSGGQKLKIHRTIWSYEGK